MRRLLILPVIGLLAACSTLKGAHGDHGHDTYGSGKEQQEMQMADNVRKSGDLKRAADMYIVIATHASDPLPAQLALAAVYRKLGQAEDALSVMRKAEANHHDDPAVLTQLGYAMIDAGQPEEAVSVFDRLIALEPDNAMAYSGKGVAFDKAGNHLAAQDLYQRALKLAPDSLAIQNNLGMSMILNGQIDQAITLLEALNGQPDSNKTVRQNLALAYGLKGNKARALELNMQDLPAEDANENMRFYEQYAKRQKKLKAADAPPSAQIGFAETPAPVRDVLEKDEHPAKAAASPAHAKKKTVKAHKKPEEKAAKKSPEPTAPETSETITAPPPAEKPADKSWHIFGGVSYSYPSQGRH